MSRSGRAALRERSADLLILTASTGAGHDSVGVALQEALRGLAPETRVRTFDPLSGGMCSGPLSPARCYNATIAHAPWLWGLFYSTTNSGWAVRAGMAAGALLWARRLRSVLQAERPRVVVAVHPLCVRLAAGVLRTIPGAPPLHCVVTDLASIHRCWACEDVAAFYVGTAEATAALVAMGIPPERIHVTGLPVRASFARTRCAPAGGATPRVLLLGGGRPSHRIEAVALTLAASSPPPRLVVVCGRDERLRRRLVRVLGERATVLGWRDDVAALMRWSSVVITRAGSVTLAEALSQARPVVIYQALAGQEAGNVTLVERSGSGCFTADGAALVRAALSSPAAQPEAGATLPAWWGGAAARVAARLVPDLAERAIAPLLPLTAATEPARRGRVIENPINGERIVIRESGVETGGRLLRFDLFLPPGTAVPSRHVHPGQQEQFTVVAGRMRFRLGRRAIIANPGDTVLVPAGAAHWFGNTGSEDAQARVEVRPALRMEELFEAAAAMGRESHLLGTRLPLPSDLALFLSDFRQELAVPGLPAFVVRAVLAPLAWLGRRRAARRGNRAAVPAPLA